MGKVLPVIRPNAAPDAQQSPPVKLTAGEATFLGDWASAPLPSYSWRGRVYKTVTGICRAAMVAHAGASVNFDASAMVIHYREGRKVRYPRTFDAAHNSIIASDPQ